MSKKELLNLKYDIGLFKSEDCSETENRQFAEMVKRGEPLPENIGRYTTPDGKQLNQFYRSSKGDMTDEETKQYILLKQYALLKTIRNCVVFFTALTAIGLVFTLISLLL